MSTARKLSELYCKRARAILTELLDETGCAQDQKVSQAALDWLSYFTGEHDNWLHPNLGAEMLAFRAVLTVHHENGTALSPATAAVLATGTQRDNGWVPFMLPGNGGAAQVAIGR